MMGASRILAHLNPTETGIFSLRSGLFENPTPE